MFQLLLLPLTSCILDYTQCLSKELLCSPPPCERLPTSQQSLFPLSLARTFRLSSPPTFPSTSPPHSSPSAPFLYNRKLPPVDMCSERHTVPLKNVLEKKTLSLQDKPLGIQSQYIVGAGKHTPRYYYCLENDLKCYQYLITFEKLLRKTVLAEVKLYFQNSVESRKSSVYHTK